MRERAQMPDSTVIKCNICGNMAGNAVFSVPEKMFGFPETFGYFECGDCGCVQAVRFPENPGRYYPDGYYSFSPPASNGFVKIKNYLRRQWFLNSFYGGHPIGRILAAVRGPSEVAVWASGAGLRADSRILDVGCGGGHLIGWMRELGFVHVTGADAFIPDTITLPNGVRILKETTASIRGEFDCIMLHHSLEHMPNPYAVFHDLSRLLAPAGIVLIRIPLASSHAWRHYRADWVQLDAPRHLFLHTVRSFKLLSEKSGFRVERMEFDSTEFQFWGSELYRRGIRMNDPDSYQVCPGKSPFSRAEIRRFRQRAKSLNAAGDGDQACFYLSRK
jgi:SAM-dependent methyltransferase